MCILAPKPLAPNTCLPELGLRRARCCARLLERDRTDNRQLKPFAAVGFKHTKQPKHEARQPQNHSERYQHDPHVQGQSHDRENNAKRDRESDPRHAEEDRLERMEADERLLAIGLHHQKQDTRNESNQIAQRAGDVVGHASCHRSSRWRRVVCRRGSSTCRCRSHRRAALGTEPPLHGRSTACTKWHFFSPSGCITLSKLVDNRNICKRESNDTHTIWS